MNAARCRAVPATTARLCTVLLSAAVALLALPGAAGAVPPSQGSFLRLAHISPDTPNVDIYLASVGDPNVWFTVPGVGYGSVTDYRALPVDTYTISMRAAGAPADSPPVIATVLTTEPGAAYTVAGTGLYDDIGLTVLDDELGMPAVGTARIRVVNGAATAPTVDLAVAGGPEIGNDIPFAAATGYRTVPTGNWTVDVRPGGTAPTSLPIDIAANAVYTVLLLDRNGGLDAQLLLDSAGAPAVPAGGIDTGFGGAAGERTIWLLVGGALVGLALLGLGLIGSRMIGSRLLGTRLIGSRPLGTRLLGTRLLGTRLLGTRLLGTRLLGTRLIGTRLLGTRLLGTRLLGTRLLGTRLLGTRPAGARPGRGAPTR